MSSCTLLHGHLQRIRRDLGQHGPGAVPDVYGVDAHPVVPRRIDLHERTRGQLDGRIGRGGHPGPDEPAASAPQARRRVARLPAEALRPFPQAGDQVAATEGTPALGVDRRLVA